MRRNPVVLLRPCLWLLLIATLVGCAGTSSGPTSSASQTQGASSTAAGQPKRVVIAMAGDPPGISTHINPAGTATPGLPDLVELTSPGLSSVGSDGLLVPILAASIPSTESGTWLVSPDSSMQTTWKL